MDNNHCTLEKFAKCPFCGVELGEDYFNAPGMKGRRCPNCRTCWNVRPDGKSEAVTEREWKSLPVPKSSRGPGEVQGKTA